LAVLRGGDCEENEHHAEDDNGLAESSVVVGNRQQGRGHKSVGVEELYDEYTLQPGEVRKEYLEMWADPKARRQIVFRLGFIPKAKRPVQGAQDPTLIWSNFVTLAK
jgi:hypothetical protein